MLPVGMGDKGEWRVRRGTLWEGTVAYAAGVPQPCERCGGVPESVIEIVEVVVESPAAG